VSELSRETRVVAVSRLYATEPYGRARQPWFLNLAVRVETQASPRELLSLAKRLEARAGRVAAGRWGPRRLDVDILLMGSGVVSEPDLTIPHASLASRRFCLVPAAEVAGGAAVPPGGRTVAQLLASCEDTLEVIAI